MPKFCGIIDEEVGKAVIASKGMRVADVDSPHWNEAVKIV